MTDGREPALRRGGGADDGPESSTPRHESRAPPRAAILRRGRGGGGAASCGLREGRVPHSFAAPTRPTTRTAVPVATTSAVAAGCPEGQGGVSYIGVAQSMTGAVTGCVRLGDLPPGPVTIRLDQFLNYAKNDKGPTTRLAGPAGTSFVHLMLSPASGPPGTRVTVVGVTRHPIPASRRGQNFLNLCLDGCRDGLGLARFDRQVG